MSTYTVGNYLATRFEQMGLKHYFMVPGDYNLVLLDQLLWNKHVQQIGCCNELNAAYAAQEVANMIRYGHNNLIFLVNNRGYVIESEIHDGPYNYIKNWDYAGLIPAWNAEDGHGLGLKATTGGELADAIKNARNHRGGPILIECQIEHDDCSPQLLKWGTKVDFANERAPQET